MTTTQETEAVLAASSRQTLDVSQRRDVLEELRGFHVDVPATRAESRAFTLELEGWALGRKRRALAVELVQDETCLWRTPIDVSRPDVAEKHPDAAGADSSGFWTSFSSLRLPPAFEMTVAVVLEGDARVPVATIKGERAELRSSFEPRIQPLMVTSLGRSGSSLLMQLLAAHPDVVAYRPYEYEPRVATYWMGVLQTLSHPATSVAQLDPVGNLEGDELWWLDSEGARDRRFGDRTDPQTRDWLGGESVEELAALCQSRIEALYERIASAGTEPRYFAEKFLPTPASSLVPELYPRAREVVLVRDFRDMVASLLAFNVSRGYAGLGRELAASDDEFVVGEVRNSVLRLVRGWERRSDRAHLVRYEDLIMRPWETLEDLLSYLELDSRIETIEALLGEQSESAPEWSGLHRTSRDPKASVGRWKDDLGSELQSSCREALGFALETFGYPIEEPERTA